jgi:hypothetical protein
VESAGVQEAHVVKDGSTHAIDDWEGQFDVVVSHGIAAQGFVVGIDRTDIAIAKAAHRARTADEEAVEERHFLAIAKIIRHAGGAGNRENAIVRQENILLGGSLKLVDVGLAQERTTRKFRAEVGVQAAPRQQNAVPIVITHAEGNGAVGAVTLFPQQLGR